MPTGTGLQKQEVTKKRIAIQTNSTEGHTVGFFVIQQNFQRVGWGIDCHDNFRCHPSRKGPYINSKLHSASDSLCRVYCQCYMVIVCTSSSQLLDPKQTSYRDYWEMYLYLFLSHYLLLLLLLLW